MKQKFLDEYADEIQEDFYNENYLEQNLEDDEINAEEEGFMIGYLGCLK